MGFVHPGRIAPQFGFYFRRYIDGRIYLDVTLVGKPRIEKDGYSQTRGEPGKDKDIQIRIHAKSIADLQTKTGQGLVIYRKVFI